MTHTDANNNIYITRNVLFDNIERYIKEIHLINRTKVPIKLISQLHPFTPVKITTHVAIRPEAIRFCGSYIEHWENCLN